MIPTPLLLPDNPIAPKTQQLVTKRADTCRDHPLEPLITECDYGTGAK
jgi:hypothetical protein